MMKHQHTVATAAISPPMTKPFDLELAPVHAASHQSGTEKHKPDHAKKKNSQAGADYENR